MRTACEIAKLNLHSAKAALVTAKQRLVDAERRFGESLDCYFHTGPGVNDSLGWWRAQVELAQRCVAECQRIVLQERGDE
jgi:hypothetical protein